MGALQKKAVESTPEFRRISSLPRRAPEISDVDTQALTDVLRTPAGTMSLRPVQALALHDVATRGGLAGPIRVGGGKTLVSLLAPHVLGARRPLLLLPAALVGKTERERASLMKHWLIPRNIRIQSYEGLGRASSAQFLNLYRPDVIIADEAHRLKNSRAACTRRVTRYMNDNPETKFLAISGTFMKHSIRDFAHLMAWSLKEGSPVPTVDGEIEEWSDALDEKVNFLTRIRPGVLGRDLDAARHWFQSRVLETPGVVSTPGDAVGCSLYIRPLVYDVNAATEDNFIRLRNEWSRPDGWALSQAVDIWRHARELALGLHYRWRVDPPVEWLQRRKDWAKFARDTIKNSKQLDSELQVVNACDRGELDTTYLQRWREIRGTYEIEPDHVWHDDSALQVCQTWMQHNDGIVWCEHIFFAEELARRTGAPYYAAGGLDRRSGQAVESEVGDRPIICSVASCGTGRNLQAFSKNLVTSCFTGADIAEQLIGRTFRSGQQADAVEFDIMLGCAEHWNAFDGALKDAKMHADVLGQPQALLIADIIDWPAERADSARWCKTSAK